MFVCRGWKEVIAVRTALLPSRASEKHTLWFYFLYSMEYRWLLWSLYILLRLGPSADHQIIWNHKEMEFTGIERSQSELSAMNLRRKKKEQNIQVTKMFIVAVIVFSLSMFPNQVLWLWVDFGNGKDSDYFAIISAICWLFTYSNSVLIQLSMAFIAVSFVSGRVCLRIPHVPCPRKDMLSCWHSLLILLLQEEMGMKWNQQIASLMKEALPADTSTLQIMTLLTSRRVLEVKVYESPSKPRFN